MRIILLVLMLTLNSFAFSAVREGVSAYKSSINLTNIQLNSRESILSKYGNYTRDTRFHIYRENRPKYELTFEKFVLKHGVCIPGTFEIHTFVNYGVGQYDSIMNRFNLSLKSYGYREDIWKSYISGYKIYTKTQEPNIASVLVKVTPFTYVMSACKVG